VEHKKTIYFLEWLAKESGFLEDQILENMKPENTGWNEINSYCSIKEFIEHVSKLRYLVNAFNWRNSFLKPEYIFWGKINNKWFDLVDDGVYNIEFSEYPIKNWRVNKFTKKIKVKSKKLKI
jgi:hypothetical protein